MQNHHDIEASVRIADIISRHFEGTLNAEEQHELDAWLNADEHNRDLMTELSDEAKRDIWLQQFQTYDLDEGRAAIQARIAQPEISTRRKRWVSYAAAAAVIIALAGTYLWKKSITAPPQPKTLSVSPYGDDVAPGGNKATLTLANGTKIDLDSTETGTLATQANTRIVQLSGGQLAYRANTGNGKTDNVPLNTLTTPKGGQYKITLPDGTKVWLNSASSLIYPVAFTGRERIVQLAGEAYFEVVHDGRHPFTVKVGNTAVRDVGTAFNIKAYSDEKQVTATVAEGIVKVTAGKGTALLRQDQQGVITGEGSILVGKANVDEAIAWKNGIFQFDNETIEPIMREVARWYDVQIVYKGTVGQHFVGKISRNEPISRLLQLLELTGNVHFRIEGRTITVLP